MERTAEAMPSARREQPSTASVSGSGDSLNRGLRAVPNSPGVIHGQVLLLSRPVDRLTPTVKRLNSEENENAMSDAMVRDGSGATMPLRDPEATPKLLREFLALLDNEARSRKAGGSRAYWDEIHKMKPLIEDIARVLDPQMSGICL